jgi:hypothetical protein
MMIPLTFFNIGSHPGYVTWEVFGHILGVHSPITATIAASLPIHLIIATCIGIRAGLFLFKTNIFNISKPSNGLDPDPYTSYSTGVIIIDCDYVSFIKNKFKVSMFNTERYSRDRRK